MVEGVVVGSIKCCAQGKLSGVANVGVGAGWGRRPGRLEKEIESRERIGIVLLIGDFLCTGISRVKI